MIEFFKIKIKSPKEKQFMEFDITKDELKEKLSMYESLTTLGIVEAIKSLIKDCYNDDELEIEVKSSFIESFDKFQLNEAV